VIAFRFIFDKKYRLMKFQITSSKLQAPTALALSEAKSQIPSTSYWNLFIVFWNFT